MKSYIPRIVDKQLEYKLATKGAVWIKGPKWCGKSTTAKRVAKTVIMMQDERKKEQKIALAKADPSYFLKGETPVLIDEWQIIPFIWNQVRLEVDERDEFGQFILTGSVMPNTDLERHSGIGRITELIMRPMSLFESGESNGSFSLSGLAKSQKQKSSKNELSLEDYAFLTARGGWPSSIGLKRNHSLQQAIDYFDGLVNVDIRLPDGVKRNSDRMRLLLRSYARNCSTCANISTIKKDMFANDNETLNENTVSSYICALKELFVVEDSECWSPNIRSSHAIRTSNTRYFVDPSIACAALGLDPDGLMNDIRTFGLLFENLCIRDLRIYADNIGATVRHYRDSSNLEVDAIIVFRDGTWGAIEVKLGSQDLIDLGAKNLLNLAEKVDEKISEPRFMAVITATECSYQREDGVWVVPLGCLGP